MNPLGSRSIVGTLTRRYVIFVAQRTARTQHRDVSGSRQFSRCAHRLTGPVFFPAAWPRQMSADIAAAYCGEMKVQDFLRRVGSEYPPPRRAEGRRRLWLKDDLDDALMKRDSSSNALDEFS